VQEASLVPPCSKKIGILVTLLVLFGGPIVSWGPGNCAPLPPSLRPWLQLPLLKSLCEDACNGLASNFSIHDVIKILPKLPVSEIKAFSGVCKPLGLLLFQLTRMPHHRSLFSTKAIRNLYAYNHGLREGHARGTFNIFPGPCSGSSIV